LRLVEQLGVPLAGDELEFPLREADFAELESLPLARRLRAGQYICLHPGARYLSRRWPSERYAALGDRLARRGLQIVITGSAAEAELARSVSQAMREPHLNFAGATTLGALAALLAGARLLISNDTGVSHVAAALRLPSVVIVTGSDPRRWAPLDHKRHRVVRHAVPCQPCLHVQCPIDHPCATGIEPQQVERAALEMLAAFPLEGDAARSAAGAKNKQLCRTEPRRLDRPVEPTMTSSTERAEPLVGASP
jgi:ADP-heptose:LPS heptosyltransferase